VDGEASVGVAGPATNSALLSAARAERDRRADSYPLRIAAGKISALDAAVDFQCWVAIAEWLETGRFFSFAGGDDPDSPAAPVIRWRELEEAAAKALAAIDAKIERSLSGGQASSDLAALQSRGELLVHIHRKLSLRRAIVDSLNAELRSTEAVAA
jgi:hypothetical protein